MLNDTFPDWLESFPKLHVLVLRDNKFHGPIRNPKAVLSFPKLRIMDLSHNEFTGALPKKYFENFKAMQMGSVNADMSYMGVPFYVNMSYTGETLYYDSVIVTMKGLEFEIERIQTIFTTIDFSSNHFSGEVPQILGELIGLKGLNLSHNMLTGTVPSSLGNLSNLEWLEIPIELASITALEILNLSHNHLEGPIPQGRQFNTFGNDSFAYNLNLCGFLLSKRCDGQLTTPLSQPDLEQEGQSNNAFNWKIVTMGYASGVLIGISIGYMLYGNGKLCWIPERIMEYLLYKT